MVNAEGYRPDMRTVAVNDTQPNQVPDSEEILESIKVAGNIGELSSKSTPAELQAFAEDFVANIGATEVPNAVATIKLALPTWIKMVEKGMSVAEAEGKLSARVLPKSMENRVPTQLQNLAAERERQTQRDAIAAELQRRKIQRAA